MTGTNDLADLCGDSIDEVLESYKEYLLVKAPEHFKAMERREKSNPEGAMFEAAMFAVSHTHLFVARLWIILGRLEAPQKHVGITDFQ